MKLEVFRTSEEVQRATAWRWLARALSGAPGCLGIATGTTTAPIYAIIAQLYAMHPFDTSRLVLCAVDDYVGLPFGHVASCAERIRRQLARPLGLRGDQLLFPGDFEGADAAADYERAIDSVGGIRMLILGLGEDAHLGFCRPGTPLNSLAHEVRLASQSRDMLRQRYGLSEEELPVRGLTLGLGSIMKAPQILVAACGRQKAAAVAAAIQGPVTEAVPASVLQLHRHVHWLIDQQAAALLRQ